ncbi:putative FBD-associated F-box protein At5g53635 [Capsella rubella]|uniref:putative FBD-associated F-box protein At5g53635 n=1 Tax=Capsella rubella TaxID=81985 RepID=UPI000CD5053A|nr:putative FBD-associated F-box protein At5g53635 [Capsella rubella]
MDAREKSVLSQRLKEDRLSQLPDPLIICHILSHLPIKQVVKTSVLSTRWRSLWLWLPSLEMELECWNFSNSFMSFGDRVSSKRNSIGRFLSQISEVKDMTICNDTLKVICHYSKLELLPQFSNMSRVQATLHHSKLEELLTFLKSCPNLKSLILVCDGIYEELLFKEMSQISFSYMPQCFLPSLEFIDLKFPIRVRLKIVRYFLENTPMLKKLTLHLADYSIQEMSTFKEALLKMTRSSSECDIVVLDWY